MTTIRRTALIACLALSALAGCGPEDGQWLANGTKQAQLNFAYHNGDQGDRLLPTIMGGGVALFDYDGDGDLDVFFTNGGKFPPQSDSHEHSNQQSK